MSYPPPLYDGDTGEVSAHVVRAGIEPAVVYPNGNKVFYLAQGSETQGTFGLYRWEFAGPASGPGPSMKPAATTRGPTSSRLSKFAVRGPSSSGLLPMSRTPVTPEAR